MLERERLKRFTVIAVCGMLTLLGGVCLWKTFADNVSHIENAQNATPSAFQNAIATLSEWLETPLNAGFHLSAMAYYWGKCHGYHWQYCDKPNAPSNCDELRSFRHCLNEP